MFARMLALLALVLCCSFSYAADSKQIPLDHIWAYGMPGTQDISKLEDEPKSEKSLIGEIGRELGSGDWGRQASKAFVVEGIGLEALKNAHVVITKQKSPPTIVKHGPKLSIVFLPCARPVTPI